MTDKILVTNRKARRDYTILESLETGIALKGAEVKSLRRGKGSLAGSYATVDNGEVWLHDFHITPYEYGNIFNPPPKRNRKLLLHRREIKKLIGQTAIKGHTLVPLRVYLKNGLVKMELGVAKGKKLYDKRQDIKKKEADREAARAKKYKFR
jgi:SsrA-binding protein